MQKTQFNDLIKNPKKHIPSTSIDDLQKLKEDFPYCEIIHTLCLLKAHTANDINFLDILLTTALHSSSRSKLFHIIHPKVSANKKVSNSNSLNFIDWLNTGSKSSKNIITKSVEDNDYLTTETLAELYVEQKHYDRAIQAYEILCLKYPKKSGLFANRINEIKNKII